VNSSQTKGRPAVLIDLFDTIVSCEWWTIPDLLSARLKVAPERIDEALNETRRARNTGILGGAQEDMRAVLQVLSLKYESPELEKELALMVERFFEDNGSFYPDTGRFLARIRGLGIKVCVVSNCSRTADSLIKRLRLRELVDEVILSYEVGACKPDADIYRMAISAVNADMAKTSYIDDNPAFCAGASAQGLRVFRVHRGDVADPARGMYPGLNNDLFREVSRIGQSRCEESPGPNGFALRNHEGYSASL
jgi:HAD superfamily hydrolase (TIGR01509 family)